MIDEIVSYEEAMQVLQCSLRTLKKALARGEVPSVKKGRRPVIPRQAFIQRLNEMALQPVAKPKPPSPARGRRRPLPAVY